MESKPIYQSKTFWLNAITLGLAIIAITDPALLGIKPETMLWLSSVLNIALRFITTGAVTLSGSSTGKDTN